MANSVVRIEAIEPRGDTLTIRHSSEGPISDYVTDSPFRLKADHPLDSVPPGILVIPFLGALVPLSWTVDCHVVAGDVDEDYLDAIAKVRSVMENTYPALKFRGSIEARPVRSTTNWDVERYCLLFSGGLDSTSSFIRNRGKKPTLLMIRGTPDVRMSEEEYWQRTMRRVPPMLRTIQGEVHAIETNALDVVHERVLKAHVHNDKIDGWWENFAHGLFLTSTCAPFTYVHHIGKLLIASSDSPVSAKPWGSMPESDDKIRWGGLAVVHDSFDRSRYEKIRKSLGPFILSQGGSWPLKLCLDKERRLKCGKLNCGLCDKCITTALMLLENGVDPSRCDFDMSGFSPARIRTGLENGYIHVEVAPFSWRFITENAGPVRPELDAKYKGLSDFFLWIQKWDRKQRESTLRSYSRLVAPTGSRRRKLARRLAGRD